MKGNLLPFILALAPFVQGQTVLSETITNTQLIFEPILLISVSIDQTELHTISPTLAGNPLGAPSHPLNIQLQFTISPPEEGYRTIEVQQQGANLPLEVVLALQQISVSNAVVNTTTPNLSVVSTPNALLQTTSGGASGTAPGDGLSYEAFIDLSSAPYHLWSSGTYFTNLLWRVY